MATFHLLVVDDHPLILKGLHKELEKNFFPLRISLANNGAKAIEILKNNSVDLLITDWEMPGTRGYEVAGFALANNVKTMVFTSHTEISYLLEMKSLGVKSILLKSMTEDETMAAIMIVMEGGTYIHPDIAYVFCKKDENSNMAASISKREIDVLQLIVNGLKQPDISVRLNICKQTVEKHRGNILRKLKAKTMSEAIGKAIKLGVIKDSVV
jgi:DNA-binding NarL/FixJ family response regulator